MKGKLFEEESSFDGRIYLGAAKHVGRECGQVRPCPHSRQNDFATVRN